MDRTETQSWMDTIEALHGKILGLESSLSAEKARADRLEGELAKRKLKWQKGKPSANGWYLTRFLLSGGWSVPDLIHVNLQTHPYEGTYFWVCRQWAGPIEPPEES